MLASNVRYRRGELDLVCMDGETTVFVEVRYRRRNALVSASQSITDTKRRRIRFAASHFLLEHPRYARRPCRFDVVTVTGNGGDGGIEWIKSAFQDA